jgi:Na+-driven multidrug efflux pump
MAVAGAAHILMMALILLTEKFIEFDGYGYPIPDDIVWLTYLYFGAAMVVIVSIILRSIKHLKPKEWISLLSYVFFVLASYCIQFAFPDIWIAWVGCTVALFVFFVNIQVELRQKMKEDAGRE